LIRTDSKGAWLCCAAICVLFGVLQVHAQLAVGVVSKLAGTARIARAGTKLDVGNGTAVLPGDRLTADAQSSLTITFNNGGAIDLEGPLEFLVDVSDSLAPMKSIPDELLRRFSGQGRVSTFRASAMGLRAERPRLAFDTFGAFGHRPHPRRGRERVGNVLKVSGTAHVTKATSITLVHEGTPIDGGDELTTDTGAFLTLIINDDSAIDLGECSRLTAGALASTAGSGQPRLMAGTACLRLSKRFLESFPAFSVSTPNADVSVKAQKLAIRYSDRSVAYDGPSTTVMVAQGTAAVSNPIAGEKIEVGTGYETVVRGTQAPSPPKPMVSTEPCRQ
jgi:FecR protein